MLIIGRDRQNKITLWFKWQSIKEKRIIKDVEKEVTIKAKKEKKKEKKEKLNLKTGSRWRYPDLNNTSSTKKKPHKKQSQLYN